LNPYAVEGEEEPSVLSLLETGVGFNPSQDKEIDGLTYAYERHITSAENFQFKDWSKNPSAAPNFRRRAVPIPMPPLVRSSAPTALRTNMPYVLTCYFGSHQPTFPTDADM